jgi:hypothetical protein
VATTARSSGESSIFCNTASQGLCVTTGLGGGLSKTNAGAVNELDAGRNTAATVFPAAPLLNSGPFIKILLHNHSVNIK